MGPVSQRQSEPEIKPSATAEELSYAITLHVGQQGQTMDYCHAFAFAHDLLRQQKNVYASAVLQHLVKVNTDHPSAHLLLALGEAAAARYSTCLKILNKGPRVGPELAGQIYDAIMQLRLGLKQETIRDVRCLANNHQEIAALCLWLGDLYESCGAAGKATQCWKVASARDRAQGPVALAARRQIARLAKTVSDSAHDTSESLDTCLALNQESMHAPAGPSVANVS